MKHHADDLFHTPLDQLQIDFENEGGETYICGNPPYKGSQDQTLDQKSDLIQVFADSSVSSGSADYVLGWFVKACAYTRAVGCVFAFVTTNSIHQGRQVARFWPNMLRSDLEIVFGEPSFRWFNLASKKAVVTVSVIGIARKSSRGKFVFDSGLSRQANFIGPYLVPNIDTIVDERRSPLSALSPMFFGSMPNDGGNLLLPFAEANEAIENGTERRFIRSVCGTEEFIHGYERRCIWVRDEDADAARKDEFLKGRFALVERKRAASSRPATQKLSLTPHRFGEVRQTGSETIVVIAKTCSELREYLPTTLLPGGHIITEAFGLADAELWNLAVVVSRMHLVWIATVCGKLETRYRYSNTLGWNTFPVPTLTEKNKADLTRCAEDILLAREARFPKTIADLYDPEKMPADLREAHERNDEVLERIYIGRRFRNDTDRLEKLFELYTKMTANKKKTPRN